MTGIDAVDTVSSSAYLVPLGHSLLSFFPCEQINGCGMAGAVEAMGHGDTGESTRAKGSSTTTIIHGAHDKAELRLAACSPRAVAVDKQDGLVMSKLFEC